MLSGRLATVVAALSSHGPELQVEALTDLEALMDRSELEVVGSLRRRPSHKPDLTRPVGLRVDLQVRGLLRDHADTLEVRIS